MSKILTLGPWVSAWIERNLVHGPGDYLGQSFRLTNEQKRLIARAYTITPDGGRIYRRVVLGRGKGWGKSEFASALACAELAGPVRFGGWREDGSPRAVAALSPDIPVAAASFEQADLVFGTARIIVTEGPLAPFVDAYETEIQLKDRPGRMYRVAAVAGTNDGLRPTFFVADETHEWRDRKARVHLIIRNGLMKRQGSWGLEITTAGFSGDGSVAEQAYQRGIRVLSGELADPQLLFDWCEAPEGLDLTDPAQRLTAVLIANPNAELFGIAEAYVGRWDEIPAFEWERYYADRWTASASQWLPAGAWEALARKRRRPKKGSDIVLGFSAVTGEHHSAGLVACTPEGHLITLGVWESTDRQRGYLVPAADVDKAVRDAFRCWNVTELHCYPSGWQPEWDAWVEAYGEQRVARTPPRSLKLQAEACERFYKAVAGGELTHDGHPGMDRHLKAALVVHSPDGAYITHKGATGSVDLARAAVLAYERAMWRRDNPPRKHRVAGF